MVNVDITKWAPLPTKVNYLGQDAISIPILNVVNG